MGRDSAAHRIVLLDKPDGGRRPIGLFPTLIRIWMRARAIIAKRWETQHADPAIHAGEQMGAQRAAWQIAFQAENAHLTEQCYAQALLDLVKCFEKVPHPEFVAAAKKHGYCLRTLRMSLAAYRCPRAVGVDGVYSRPIVAACGITAGSGHATTELKVLLLDLILTTHKFIHDAKLILYVDDLTVQITAAKHEVPYKIAHATDWIVRYFENVLKLQVSAAKSVVIGATFNTAKKAASLMKSGKVSAARIGKALGVSPAGGAKRCVKTLKKRLVICKNKTGSMHVLRKTGLNVLQMSRAAGTSSLVYGVECTGMSNSHLASARHCTANQISAPTRGKLHEAVLHGAGAAGGHVDPAYGAHSGPIGTWALAWWQGWRDSHELNESLGAATAKLLKAKTSVWRIVTGPAAAVVATAWRIGWVFLDARRIQTEQGRVLDLLLDSPAAVTAEVRRAVRRWTFGKLLRALPNLRPSCAASGNPHTLPPRAYCVFEAAPRDWHEVPFVLGKMLHKATRTKLASEWDRSCAPYLASQMCNGQWPQSRLFATGKNWVDDDRRQLCFSAPGTLQHRSVCTTTKPSSGWTPPPKDARAYRDQLSTANAAMLDTRGLAVVRAAIPLAQEEEEIVWIKPVPDECEEHTLTWYIDGSTMDGPAATLSRTGIGFAAVDPKGKLIAYGYAVPPWWVDTTPGAEAWALNIVLKATLRRKAVVTDCMGNVNSIRNGPAWATAANRKHARIWAPIFATLDSSACDKWLSWMPAHVSKKMVGTARKSNGEAVTRIDHRANWLVDLLAKFAARKYQVPEYIRKLFDGAAKATEHAAALVGAQCKASNNVEHKSTDADGVETSSMKRDSAPLALAARRSYTVKAKREKEEAKKAAEAAALKRQSEKDREAKENYLMKLFDDESRRAAEWTKSERLLETIREDDYDAMPTDDANFCETCGDHNCGIQAHCDWDQKRRRLMAVSCESDDPMIPQESRQSGTAKKNGKSVSKYVPKHSQRKARARTDVEAQRINAKKQNERRSAVRRDLKAKNSALSSSSSSKKVPICTPPRPKGPAPLPAAKLCTAVEVWWERVQRKREGAFDASLVKRHRLSSKTAASEAARWGFT